MSNGRRLLAAAASALVLLTSCGEEVSDEEKLPYSTEGYDIVLTEPDPDLLFGQIYDMTFNADKYEGQSTIVKGYFNHFTDPANKEYNAVFVPDAAACCSQGIEFVLKGEHTFPDDYPEQGQEMVISGTFSSYDEYGVTYLQLLDADIVYLGKKEGEK
ncbi:MAG: hypothetical protein IKQ90_07260 [Ruminococcus sp.]|nr:hypothetical protein [Ruminococcus sp.]